MICLLQLHEETLLEMLLNTRLVAAGYTYYRLGKNRPSSGNLVLVSRSALSFHINPVRPMMTAPITAVFAFQFDGCEYQPPAGDQTCLGYLGV